MEATNEIVIRVQEIEPRLRHLTIFQVFDSISEGESLIIHNNHDPLPVYYQLRDLRGDVFEWEYLQQGPQWWDIRVTKKSTQNKNITKADNGDIVINIPQIEPKLKHPTIFDVFDKLEAGESLVIHNDHDPKPVYYQLLGERGDIFKWQYLEQGPQWWDVRVTKKDSTDNETIGQIAAKDLRKAEVFKKYGLDFCCGGKKTIREACEEKGIDATLVEQELQQPEKNLTAAYTNYNEWNIDFLADYITNTHHQYVRKYLPEIVQYAAKVAQVHGTQHPELANINKLVAKINSELTTHLEQEETILFPLIKSIYNKKKNTQQLDTNEIKSLTATLNELEHEHETVGNDLEEIRILSNNFNIPQDACSSYKLLYKMLIDFESDLHIHIHLENNILFPKALALENK